MRRLTLHLICFGTLTKKLERCRSFVENIKQFSTTADYFKSFPAHAAGSARSFSLPCALS